MLTDDGYCTSCRRWATDYPAGIACPWCRDRSIPPAADPHDDPLGALARYGPERARILDELRALQAVRREAARTILARDLPHPGVRLGDLERWAASAEQLTCKRGHSRAEHGRWDPVAERWDCRACAPEDRKVAAQRKKDPRPARIRDRWAAYERRVAAARAAGPVDRLREELPPPVRPAGRP